MIRITCSYIVRYSYCNTSVKCYLMFVVRSICLRVTLIKYCITFICFILYFTTREYSVVSIKNNHIVI